MITSQVPPHNKNMNLARQPALTLARCALTIRPTVYSIVITNCLVLLVTSTAIARQVTASTTTMRRPTTAQIAQPYPIYGPIQIKSKEANNNDPKAVRALVDEIFRQTGFADASPSVRDRVTRAELAYRTGLERPIDVNTFVRALNKTASALPLPGYFKTSIDQVRLQQLFVAAHAPTLWSQDDNPELLAPSEATFYALFLTYQKFFNPSYQLDPEQWARRQRALIANRPSVAFLRLQTRVQPKDNLLPKYRTFRLELARDSGDAVSETNAFFDRLGFVK
jgi:hypothetical protein